MQIYLPNSSEFLSFVLKSVILSADLASAHYLSRIHCY